MHLRPSDESLEARVTDASRFGTSKITGGDKLRRMTAEFHFWTRIHPDDLQIDKSTRSADGVAAEIGTAFGPRRRVHERR